MKPGYKTTEFWISLAAMLLSAAYASGVIPDVGPWEKLAGFAGVVLTSMGYTVNRGSVKKSIKLLIGFLAISMASGCTTMLKSDKIVAIKQRTFGISIGQNPASQSPEVKLGLVTTIFQMVPTSTNGPINAPRYFDTFQIDQTSNPFKFGINENSGFGDVSVMTNATGKAIQPAPGGVK